MSKKENKAVIEITHCKDCPFLDVGMRQSTDGFDEGHDWRCKKADMKMIEGFVEWHEVNKITVPNWCPIKSK